MPSIIRVLNIAKLTPVFFIVSNNTGYKISQQFIENLKLDPPDYVLKIEASFPGAQTAEIMMKIDALPEKAEPSLFMMEGETNSVLSRRWLHRKKSQLQEEEASVSYSAVY